VSGGAWGTPSDPNDATPPAEPPKEPSPGSAPPPSAQWQVGTAASPSPPSAGWEVGGPPAQPTKTSGLAIASLVTGLFVWCFVIPGIVAIVLGFLSLDQIKDAEGRIKGRGMAIAGIVLGYVGLGVTGLLVLAWVLSIVL
jgi:hypothetical protein